MQIRRDITQNTFTLSNLGRYHDQCQTHNDYYGMNTSVSSIRRGDWKLMEYLEDGRVELYNLKDDLGEMRDLAAVHPATADELRRQLYTWRQRVAAPMLKPNPAWR